MTNDTIDPICICLQPSIALAADSGTGRLLGFEAEGTLGIVFSGGLPNSFNLNGWNEENGDWAQTKRHFFNTPYAIRIPRMLESELLLNFQIAESAFHEGTMATKIGSVPNAQGAINFYRSLSRTADTKIPGTNIGNCFVGFYLSPTANYEICLVSEEKVWPQRLEQFLKKIKRKPGDLYREIAAFCENSSDMGGDSGRDKKIGMQRPPANHLCDDLLFLAETQDIHSSEMQEMVASFGRSDLNRLYAERESRGWWFNVPVTTFTWLHANLEMLLTAFVNAPGGVEDESVDHLSTGLLKWSVPKWIELLKSLCNGLVNIHRRGSVHGDPRPANIMVHSEDLRDIAPENFAWIDVGLGFPDGNLGSLEESEGQTVVAPRPLGGGRSTIFYAPERVESIEYEDADVVELKPHPAKTKNGKFPFSQLHFLYKPHTSHAGIQLKLSDGPGPGQALARLRKGDRIQIREFVFEVHGIDRENHYLIISHIYELVMGRLLVELNTPGAIESLYDRLKHASIARYRIFQSWTQSSDIYSLGLLALYIFFVKGLRDWNQQRIAHEQATQSETQSKAPLAKEEENPVQEEKPNESKGQTRPGFWNEEIKEEQEQSQNRFGTYEREMAFSELGQLLRSRSLLDAFVIEISDSGCMDIDSFLDPTFIPDKADARTSQSDLGRVGKLCELISSFNPNFDFVKIGVGNDQLFIRLLHFCLSCVWRKEELDPSLKESTENKNKPKRNFRMEPFACSRTDGQNDPNASDETKAPARLALQALEDLIVRAYQNNDWSPLEAAKELDRKVLLDARDGLIERLRSQTREKENIITQLQAKCEKLNHSYSKHLKNMHSTDKEVEELREQNQQLSHSVEQLIKSENEASQTIASLQQQIRQLSRSAFDLRKGMFISKGKFDDQLFPKITALLQTLETEKDSIGK